MLTKKSPKPFSKHNLFSGIDPRCTMCLLNCEYVFPLIDDAYNKTVPFRPMSSSSFCEQYRGDMQPRMLPVPKFRDLQLMPVIWIYTNHRTEAAYRERGKQIACEWPDQNSVFDGVVSTKTTTRSAIDICQVLTITHDKRRCLLHSA